MNQLVLLYDTLLRDGTQGEEFSLSAEEKLRIAKELDKIGIHFIEGGWPGANPKDTEFFSLMKEVKLKNAKLVAFGSTRLKGVRTKEDKNLKNLIEAGTEVVAIVGKSWDLQVKEVLKTSLVENERMIKESVQYLKKKGKEVIFDAEHFFDGYKENVEYSLKTLIAAIEGGADYIVLCDTRGGCLPWEIERIIIEVNKALSSYPDVQLGIHTHNDSGFADANSVLAVKAGVVMVQGTINGYGERCGNASLTSVIPNLVLKMGIKCMSAENLAKLKKLSIIVDELANRTPFNGRPFVGKSAFAHKGGLHVSALQRLPEAYEHVDPSLVGNERRILVSDLGGKSNIVLKAREMGIDLDTQGDDPAKLIFKIKELEKQGFQFDVADASFKLLLLRYLGQFNPSFKLESFRVTIEKDADEPCKSQATIKIAAGGKTELTAAEGNGPVNALDNALRKALETLFPNFDSSMHLVNYKVRIVENGGKGTDAIVRVLIDSRDETGEWSTIGVSEDIIEASWQALRDSILYRLAN
ncbi:MAG: citramalate synthase [Patescibacteria group bacterium]